MRLVHYATCFLPVASVGVLGCMDPGACTTSVERAIEVEVRDAISDQFIAGPVRGIVRDGSFADSLRVIGVLGTDPALPTTFGAADERQGVYEVHIEGDGYVPWDTTGVAVGSGACHVLTQRFTARLIPIATLPDPQGR